VKNFDVVVKPKYFTSYHSEHKKTSAHQTSWRSTNSSESIYDGSTWPSFERCVAFRDAFFKRSPTTHIEVLRHMTVTSILQNKRNIFQCIYTSPF